MARKLSRPVKCFLVVLACLTWIAVSFVLFSIHNSQPTEQYARWLQNIHSPPRPGFIEVQARRFGITYFATQQLLRQKQLTETLLKRDDYSLVVASNVDQTTRRSRIFETWPLLKSTLQHQLQGSDPKGLLEAHSLVKAASFSTWDITIVRSAYLNNQLDEIPPLVEELREHETRCGLDSSLSSTLERTLHLSNEPLASLARILTDPSLDPEESKTIYSVLSLRGSSVQHAFLALLAELQKGTLTEPLFGLINDLLVCREATGIRTELLFWMLSSRDCLSYRCLHASECFTFTENYLASAPDGGNQFINSAIEMIQKQEDGQLSGDWQVTAGFLLDHVSRSPILTERISAKNRPSFSWFCHILGKTDLLLRSISEWGETLEPQYVWIGRFVDQKSFSAVCALIESNPEENPRIGSYSNPNSYENPGTLSTYTDLIHEILPHAKSPQTKGFIQFAIAERASVYLHADPDKEGAELVMNQAIERLNEAETQNEQMLENTVIMLLSKNPETFVLGRPCFDRWRGALSFDDIAEAAYRGEWNPTKNEKEIWLAYAKQVDSLEGVPRLCTLIAEILRTPPGNELHEEGVVRLRELLHLSTLGKNDATSGNMEFAVWFLVRQIRSGQAEESVPWLFARMKEFATRFPEANASSLFGTICYTLIKEFQDRPLSESMDWLSRILDRENSGDFEWPSSFSEFVDRDTKLDMWEAGQVYRKSFASHPLRIWIVRKLFYSISWKQSSDDEKKSISRFHELAEDDWLRIAFDGYNSNSIDLDEFEKTMADAPANARNWILNYFSTKDNCPSFKKHPSGRDLTDEEILRLLSWEAEQALGPFETPSGDSPWNDTVYYGYFTKIINELVSYPLTDRTRSIIARFHGIRFSESDRSGNSNMIKEFEEWKSRTRYLLDPSSSEIDDLLTNEDIAITERVWRLVINDRGSDARKLMMEREDELTFASPPQISRKQFRLPAVTAFPETFPEGSALRFYSEFYLDCQNFRYTWSSPYSNPDWDSYAKSFEHYEKSTREFAAKFEATEFTSPHLERLTFDELCRIRGAGVFLTKVIERLSANPVIPTDLGRLPFARFEAQVASGEFAKTGERLTALTEASKSEECLEEGLEILRYGLWKRAITNGEFDSDAMAVLETVAFESHPGDILAPSVPGSKRHNPSFNRGREFPRMQALHFALRMIQKGPPKKEEWTWSDFSDLGFDRYQREWGERTLFFHYVTSVVAARCRNWDEDSRWRLMALFHSHPNESRRKIPVQPFFSFAAAECMNQDEAKRRARDFAIRYPHDGWNFYNLNFIGRQFEIPELRDFGLEEAKKYASQNPFLAKSLARIRVATKPPSQ